MVCYFQKNRILTELRSFWFQLCFPFALLILVLFLSGCSETVLIHPYFNPETSIKLERPDNWTVKFFERNWMIVLETKTGIWNKDSARIEILGGSCPTILTNTNNKSKTLSEILEDEINRYGLLYDQQEVQIVQEPKYIENKNMELIKAMIQIPTMIMEDPIRIQVGNPERNKYQSIEIIVLQDPDFRQSSILTSIYRGNSRVLNEQAEGIVNSIQLSCIP